MGAHHGARSGGTGTRTARPPGWKRALDLVLVAAAAPVALPLGLVVAAVVRARLGSPVLFRQRRPGLGHEPFELVKFRTMTDERGPDGELLVEARRMTATGSWLRRTSLDELPELWNVLRGDMSLVGPRPLLLRYVPHLTDTERTRADVRPGLTGPAQLNGRNRASWTVRLADDVAYVRSVSLAGDLRILARTVPAVLLRRGALEDPGAHMLDLDAERSAA